MVQEIRSLKSDDFRAAHKIHMAHYQETPEVDFNHSFIASFVVEDASGIVTLGGIRLNPEIVLVTDMDRSVRARHDALYRVLDASKFICVKHNYDQVYAFVTDALYSKQLQEKSGFKPAVAETLILNL